MSISFNKSTIFSSANQTNQTKTKQTNNIDAVEVEVSRGMTGFENAGRKCRDVSSSDDGVVPIFNFSRETINKVLSQHSGQDPDYPMDSLSPEQLKVVADLGYSSAVRLFRACDEAARASQSAPDIQSADNDEDYQQWLQSSDDLFDEEGRRRFYCDPDMLVDPTKSVFHDMEVMSSDVFFESDVGAIDVARSTDSEQDETVLTEAYGCTCDASTHVNALRLTVDSCRSNVIEQRKALVAAHCIAKPFLSDPLPLYTLHAALKAYAVALKRCVCNIPLSDLGCGAAPRLFPMGDDTVVLDDSSFMLSSCKETAAESRCAFTVKAVDGAGGYLDGNFLFSVNGADGSVLCHQFTSSDGLFSCQFSQTDHVKTSPYTRVPNAGEMVTVVSARNPLLPPLDCPGVSTAFVCSESLTLYGYNEGYSVLPVPFRGFLRGAVVVAGDGKIVGHIIGRLHVYGRRYALVRNVRPVLDVTNHLLSSKPSVAEVPTSVAPVSRLGMLSLTGLRPVGDVWGNRPLQDIVAGLHTFWQGDLLRFYAADGGSFQGLRFLNTVVTMQHSIGPYENDLAQVGFYDDCDVISYDNDIAIVRNAGCGFCPSEFRFRPPIDGESVIVLSLRLHFPECDDDERFRYLTVSDVVTISTNCPDYAIVGVGTRPGDSGAIVVSVADYSVIGLIRGGFSSYANISLVSSIKTNMLRYIYA